jgi:hypothetical protein
VSPVEDQEPVQALGAGGADETLGDGVGPRRPDRRANDREALAAKDIVEAADEPAISVTD